MATVTSPLTHAQFDGGAIQFRQAFGLLRQAILMRLQERASLRQAGALLPLGDLAGSGSDTVRTRYYNGIGWGATMSSVSETATPSRASITAEVEDVQVGRFHIGFSQTYQDVILRSPGELDLMAIADELLNTWEATWMALVASTITAAAADYGTSGADMTFDDFLDVIGYYRTLDGFDGPLFGMLHGQQLHDLSNSMRAEPGFQMPEVLTNAFQVRGAGFQFDMMGASIYQSNRVTSSGGNRHGAFFGNGAMAWAVAGTGALAPHVEDGSRTQLVPELGLIVERDNSANGAALTLDANAWLGMDINDDSQLRGMVTDA